MQLLHTDPGWQGSALQPCGTPAYNTCKELREVEILLGAHGALHSLHKRPNSFRMRTRVHLLAIILLQPAGLLKQKCDSPHFG